MSQFQAINAALDMLNYPKGENMPNLKQMWQTGASYEELHRADSPHSRCECSHCDMMRLFEEWDEWAWNQGDGAPEYPYHQHECEECADRWDCVNDLCDSLVTVMDRCDNCEDGR